MKITISGSAQEIADLMGATGLKTYEFRTTPPTGQISCPVCKSSGAVVLEGGPEQCGYCGHKFPTWEDEEPNLSLSPRALEGFRKLPEGTDGVSTGDSAVAFEDFAYQYVHADPQERPALVGAALRNGGIVAHMLAAGSIYEAFVATNWGDGGTVGAYPTFATIPENPAPTLRHVCSSIITLGSLEGLFTGHAAPLKKMPKEEPK